MAQSPNSLPIDNDNDDAPARRREMRPVDSLQQAVNRIFDDFGRGFFATPFFRRPGRGADLLDEIGSMPAADVAEHERDYEITVELPGMEPKDVDVKLANNVLTITGEKKTEREEKKKDYFLSERRFGSFKRSFQIPEGVDETAIAADFSKGVLTVTLPKTTPSPPSEKKIDVKGG